MTETELKSWLTELPPRISTFLTQLKGQVVPGFYHYSLTGDLLPEKTHWGLGNTVFAVKILHALQILPTLPATEREQLGQFITSFTAPNGALVDPVVARRAWLVDKLLAIRTKDFNNFWHQQTRIAETRQAISVLKLLGRPVKHPYSTFPQTPAAIITYLQQLDWTHPWGAGSHFSHLLFFLHHSELSNRQKLLEHAIAYVQQLQHSDDGAWYTGQPNLQQKINGAMKILTGLKVTGTVQFPYAQQLIDTCLEAAQDTHACDNFNVVYVLKYAQTMAPDYRRGEIRAFALNRLDIYHQYYFLQHGGFSFRRGRANDRYYGAKITRGLPEPDIHGTVLFLWGISIIIQILDWNTDISLAELVS